MLNLEDKRVNPFGEVFFTEVNQLLFAKEPSEAIYKRHFSELLKHEEMLFVIIGTDSGLFYKFIKNQELPGHLKFVFIDFDEVYAGIDLQGELSNDLDQQVNLVTASFNIELLAASFQTYFLRHKVQLIKSMAVIDSPNHGNYDLLWLEKQAAFNNLVNRIYIAQNTMQFDNARLYNVADNVIPIKQLGEPLTNLTAIILGGGPTLDENIDWIKLNQENLVIFSVARIAQRLNDEGIVPDFFVSVDPHDVSFDNSKGIFAFEERSILLHSYHVNPKLLSQWTGIKAYGGNRYGWKSTLPVNIAAPGPTVVNTAFHFAVEMGCQHVLLSGVDFCFPAGKTHEKGSNESRLFANLALSDLITITNNVGDLVETKPTLMETKLSFERQIKFFKTRANSLKVISLGSQSAKMDDVEYQMPDQLNLDKTPNISNALKHIKNELTISIESYHQHIKSTIVDIDNQLKRFKTVHKYAVDGFLAVPKLIDKKSQQPKKKTKDKLEKLRKKINNALNDDADMLMNYNFIHFMDNFNPDQSNIENIEAASEQLSVFFHSVKQSSQEFLHLLEISKERAQLRLSEVVGDDPTKLFPYWLKYEEFGRSRFWLRFNEMPNSDDEISCINDAFNSFKAELANVDTKLAGKLKQSIHSLPVLLERIKQARKEGKFDKLNDIVEVASQLTDTSDKKAIMQLVEAMQAEILSDKENAFKLYTTLEEHRCRQLGLQYAADIAIDLQRYHDAMQVLEELCRFSIDYMLPYADLVDLLGQTAFAVDILNLYITQKPDAYLINVKIANMYTKLGQKADAIAALQRVLLVEPENKTALSLLKALQ
ncbi:motility associated factor glycosyltransferase family protein [Thiomicrospira sp. ALE5]|uniref:motility associated factor glycosyltransferase family protein n=1 Tax=Thiomicrospira sp. ALE5 TaxID=748650 RepID=UPI0008E50E25|nr:6-hydroxymethylpterin diphosphokinase MptE-like protein [Thiomicrospira sp. ALE5]SFR59370.1 Uncharacterized conserved protein [Thiomicrospira sp. ALE5]